MKNVIREPKQERSIEKKNRIIEAGYTLFSEVGYYGTNTAEIAKKAQVSTGIVYGYFKDKRDILICVLEIYIQKVFEPVLKILDKFNENSALTDIVEKILNEVIKTHKTNKKIHESLHSLSSSDEAVGAKFIALEDNITSTMANKLLNLGIKTDNILEKVHFALDIVQSFSHEYIFDKHEYIDYSVMKKMVIDSIVNLFK